MKIYFLFLSAPGLIALAPSCKPAPDYSRDIARLDSALLERAVIYNAWKYIDTSAILALISKTEEKLSPVSEKLKADTILKTQALFLSDCYQTKDHLKQALENRKYFAEELEKNRQRIENLEHDLMENLLEENKAREYVVNELNALEELTGMASSAFSNMQVSAAALDSLQGKITAFADSLQTK